MPVEEKREVVLTNGGQVEETIEEDQVPSKVPKQQDTEELTEVASGLVEDEHDDTDQESISHSRNRNRRSVLYCQQRRRLLLREIPQRSARMLAKVDPRILAEADAARHVDRREHKERRVEEQLHEKVLPLLHNALLERVVHQYGVHRDVYSYGTCRLVGFGEQERGHQTITKGSKMCRDERRLFVPDASGVFCWGPGRIGHGELQPQDSPRFSLPFVAFGTGTEHSSWRERRSLK